MADLTIEAEAPKALTANLVGVEYQVRPVKGSIGISLAQDFRGQVGKDGKAAKGGVDPKRIEKLNKTLNRVIDMMFVSKDDRASVHERMKDPDDLLDFQHIFTLMEKLTEHQAGNPTTSPSDSSES